MEDQTIIGTVTSSGLSPIFIKSPRIDKEFRVLKKGEQSPLYKGSLICLYVDSKEGVQVYSLQPSTSPRPVNPTKRTTVVPKEEEFTQFAHISSNKTIQRLLLYCSKATQQMESTSLPSLSLPSTLHPHQQKGVSWLVSIYNHGYNGILADEMGLGKTVQVLCFLQYLHTHSPKSQFIIVVPTSLLFNWEKEIRKWTPELSCLVVAGSQEKREYEASILLTSYSLFERDSMHTLREWVYHRQYDVCILDEGHCIKNNTSKRYTRLMKLRCKHKFLLSGTPIQNNIHELFALLAFLHPTKAPELFGIAKELEKKAKCGELILHKVTPDSSERLVESTLQSVKPDSSERLVESTLQSVKPDSSERLVESTSQSTTPNSTEKLVESTSQSTTPNSTEIIISTVQKILHPFILRRVKKDVLLELPKKVEIMEKVQMKPFQQSLYDQCILRYDKQLDGKYDLVQLYMDLRKIANHPLLLRSIYTPTKIHKIAKAAEGAISEEELTEMSDIEIHSFLLSNEETYPSLTRFLLTSTQLISSCKTDSLVTLVDSLLEQQHRILIFSQWVMILDIIETVLFSRGIETYRVDGQTQVEERQQQVDDFNAHSNVNVFLLTTRSGGLGFNLTGADTVIIHDSDYNPTFDRQAEDRCHRIGQTKEVTVYKLITTNSVDEKIYEISQKKAALGDTILSNQITEKEFLQNVLQTTTNLIS